MAISKERLEELIEQGATVWDNIHNESVDLKNICEKHYTVYELSYISIYDNEYDYIQPYFLSSLEEDAENAKFKFEYQNITRTETLNLPTWEEIQKIKEFFFIDANNKEVEISIRKDILIWTSRNFGTYIFQKSLTKENYLEACDICKKLFLGEEV